MNLAFHLVNVFAIGKDPFSGNPLCVFEDGSALNALQMQALARQFNLSETTFILPSDRGTAGVRIFTPDYEMPFAGHPTLGTAAVVAALGRMPAGGAPCVLDMPAGLIPVTRDGDEWTLRANAPTDRSVDGELADLATALGLARDDLVSDTHGPRPLWVSTGSEQLIVPVASVAAVQRAAPVVSLMRRFANVEGRNKVLVFAFTAHDQVLARFFFEGAGTLPEDPATGSACANLGGWCLRTGLTGPRRLTISQGERVQRPSRLTLTLDAAGQILVGGRVRAIGRGELEI